MVKPIWYYNLNSKTNSNYFIDYHKLTDDEKKFIDYSNLYEHDKSSLIDATYQAWHKGFINLKNSKPSLIDHSMSINDQYVFIKRMFNPFWSYYVLLLRILLFKVTLKELIFVYKIRDIKKIDLYNSHFTYSNYDSFESNLIKKEPLVTIIIPTLNRYPELKNVLNDLEYQTYTNFEIIVVDQSIPFKQKFYNSYDLKIKLINQKEKGLWRARNTAISHAKGDFILLLDDDSRLENSWIYQHLKCIDYFSVVDISAGVSISMVGAPTPQNYSYFRWADQLDTGNTMLKNEVFQRTGLFDTQFEGMRMGDGEFGARAFMNGFRSVSNPKARRFHLKSKDGGLRETSGWDGMRPKSIFEPRPIPSVLYLYRKYWGNKSSILSLIQTLPTSLGPYRIKGTGLGKLVSLIILLFFFPFVILQVLRAWIISSKMLKNATL